MKKNVFIFLILSMKLQNYGAQTQVFWFCSFIRDSITFHLLTCSHHFVNKQKLLGKSWSDVQPLLFHYIVIIDSQQNGRHCFIFKNVYTDWGICGLLLMDKVQDHLLYIITTIFNESLILLYTYYILLESLIDSLRTLLLPSQPFL